MARFLRELFRPWRRPVLEQHHDDIHASGLYTYRVARPHQATTDRGCEPPASYRRSQPGRREHHLLERCPSRSQGAGGPTPVRRLVSRPGTCSSARQVLDAPRHPARLAASRARPFPWRREGAHPPARWTPSTAANNTCCSSARARCSSRPDLLSAATCEPPAGIDAATLSRLVGSPGSLAVGGCPL